LLWSLQRGGEPEAVLQAYRQLAEAMPTTSSGAAAYLAGSAHQDLGQHEQAAGRLAEAADVLQRFDSPLAEQALYKLAVSQYRLNQLDAMTQTIARLGNRYPESSLLVDAEFLQAASAAEGGDVAAAANRLSALIDRGEDHPYYQQALLRRARLYERHERWEPAAEDYRRFAAAVDQHDEQSAAAVLRLIELDTALGNPEQAAQAAEALLEHDGLPAAVVQEALFRIGRARQMAGDGPGAIRAYQRLRGEYPLSPQRHRAGLELGVLLTAAGMPDRALPLLTEAGADPELEDRQRVAAWRLAWALQREAGEPGRAAESLQAVQRIGGDEALGPAELVWLGRRLLDDGRHEAARAALDAVVQRPGVEPAPRLEALLWRSVAERRLGQFDAARRGLTEVVAMSERLGEPARLEMARVSFDEGQLRQGLGELEGLTTSVGNPAVAAEALLEAVRGRRALAARLAEQNAADQATQQREEARRQALLLVVMHEGRRSLVQPALLHAAELSGELGDHEAADEHLESLIQGYDSPWATYAEARRSADRQQPSDARARLRRLSGEQLAPELQQRVEALRAELGE
jgi:tetratricopeptide (TPR) repeat protein